MILSPGLRKLTLTVHITVLAGWVGAAAALIALTLVALIGLDPQLTRVASLVMDPITRFAIFPLACISLCPRLTINLTVSEMDSWRRQQLKT